MRTTYKDFQYICHKIILNLFFSQVLKGDCKNFTFPSSSVLIEYISFLHPRRKHANRTLCIFFLHLAKSSKSKSTLQFCLEKIKYVGHEISNIVFLHIVLDAIADSSSQPCKFALFLYLWLLYIMDSHLCQPIKLLYDFNCSWKNFLWTEAIESSVAVQKFSRPNCGKFNSEHFLTWMDLISPGLKQLCSST